MTQQQFIQQLKQQPRHGMPSSTEWTNFFDQLITAAQGVPAALAEVVTIVSTSTTDAFIKLDSQVLKTNLGISQFISLNQTTQDSLMKVAQAATFYEKGFKDISKSMGVGFNAAAKLSSQFLQMSKDMSGNSAETKISAELLSQYSGNIKKLLPNLKQLGANMQDKKGFYQGLMQTNFLLDQSIGLSAEQADSFSQYAAANAGNAAQQLKFTLAVAEAFGDTQGDMGYVKMITEAIAEAGSDIQLQYGRLPGSLEKAAIKAASLGLKLEDLAESGEALLDIENSIGKELEYQLLTGNRLVNDQEQSLTNLYREATLRGDMNAQADVMTQIVGEQGEMLEKNLFARKQMADLLGIQEQQLASAIQKQKILDKAAAAGLTINLDDDGSIAAAAERLAETGELTAEELKKFQTNADQRDTEELLKQQLQMSTESLIMQKIDFARNSTQAMRDDFTAAVDEMTAAQADMNQTRIDNLATLLLTAQIPGTIKEALTGVVQAGGINTPKFGKAETTNDLIATPTGYGDRILLAGEDTFALNNDDTIVAGTNLFPNTSTGGSNMAAKIDELIAEIRNQTRILSKRDNTFGAGINSAYYG